MNRHYYDYGRRTSRSHGPGGGLFGFLFPFLLLIVVGIVAVLGFRLFYSYFVGTSENGVFLYVVEGQAQIKMWGTSDYVKAYNQTKVLQGDEVYTAKDSKVVVEFEDGLVARLGGETSVVFNEIYDDGGQIEVDLVVKSGALWINKTSADSSGTMLSVLMDNVLITPGEGGVIFEVENRLGYEAVRTVYGSINVDVYSENGGTQVDHIVVEEGKEALFDADVMGRFWKFQAPNVLDDLSFEFNESPWYVWNVLEDEEPSDFSREDVEVVGEVELEAELEVVDSEVEVESEPEVVEPEVVELVLDLGPLENPKILKINGVDWDSSMFEEGLQVETETIKMEGSIVGAYEVIVNEYNLQRFEPREGEELFTYWMSEEYENLVEGENVYEIYVLDKDGSRSGSVFFKVVWTPKVVEVSEIPDIVDETEE